MTDPDPQLLARLAEFLREKRTGEVAFNVKCGVVRSVKVTEVLDANQPPPVAH